MSQGPAEPTSARTLAKLGDYWLLAELARGGMGVVFLALAPKSEEHPAHLVVVKEMITDGEATEAELLAFGDEAEVAIRLEHPNVARTMDVGVEDGRHFMVLEYLEGQSLLRVRKRMTRTGVGEVTHMWMHVIAEALEGLHAAHELTSADGMPLGLVHRDVSPHNIFVTYDGDVKVMDFGIAKTADSSTHTSTGVLKGKTGFMAPEQVTGNPIDRRADLFAMGLVLFELVSGKRLWEGKSDIEIVQALLMGTIPDPATDAVPEGLAVVLRKALAADPDQRFETALSMQAALREALAMMGAEPYDPVALGAELADLYRTERTRAFATVNAQVRVLMAEGETDLEHLLSELPSESAVATVVPPPGALPAPASPSLGPVHVATIVLGVAVVLLGIALLLLRP
jgi:eukaryotic-like serine/threonine-protein kinase